MHMLLTTTANADSKYYELLNDLSDSQQNVFYWVRAAFNSGDGVKEWLKFKNTDFSMVNAIWSYLEIVGVCMLIIYFLFNVNKTMLMQGNDFELKSLYALLMKFVIGYLVVTGGRYLVSTIFTLNNTIIDWIDSGAYEQQVKGVETVAPFTMGDGKLYHVVQYPDGTKKLEEVSESNDFGSSQSEIYQTFHDEIKTWGMIKCLTGSISFMLMGLGGLVASLIMIYHAVGRKLEMLIRAALTPVALGDIYNGENSTAMRYLKKMLALAVSGFAMIALYKIGITIQMADVAARLSEGNLVGVENMLRIILVPLAMAGMFSTVKQICNDLFGV